VSVNVAKLKNGLMDIRSDDHTIWPVGTSKRGGNSGGTNSVKGTNHN
jgi:hypothetical protein